MKTRKGGARVQEDVNLLPQNRVFPPEVSCEEGTRERRKRGGEIKERQTRR